MIKSFSQAVKFLEKYIPTPDKKHPGELGIRRMRYFMDLVGNPQLKYPTIHVGGTSGKGSTATIIASILSTKYKVGLHTSPHLVRINERIKILIYGSCRSSFPNYASKSHHSVGLKASEASFGMPSFASPVINTNDIPDKDFIDLVNYLKPFVEKIEKSKFGPPSYFEIVSAMAFVYFYRQKVDIAVIEVGMGGRYDATNVISPLVAVLTNVGLDHTEILGDTVEKIAEDKAGIIKHNMQVVTGVAQPSVIKIIESRITNHGARLSLLRRDFDYKLKRFNKEGSVFDYQGEREIANLKLRLLGQYQVENAAIALRTIELIQGGRTSAEVRPLKEKDIRKGLKNAFMPGRLEIISKKPLVILDGAHNPDKVKALVNSLKVIFPQKKITSIIAIKNDKDAQDMLRQLLAISRDIIFTKFQLTADVGTISSYDPEKLSNIARNIDKKKKLYVIKEAKKAVVKAVKSAKPNDLILVTGSLYLVGEIKKVIKQLSY